MISVYATPITYDRATPITGNSPPLLRVIDDKNKYKINI